MTNSEKSTGKSILKKGGKKLEGGGEGFEIGEKTKKEGQRSCTKKKLGGGRKAEKKKNQGEGEGEPSKVKENAQKEEI